MGPRYTLNHTHKPSRPGYQSHRFWANKFTCCTCVGEMRSVLPKGMRKRESETDMAGPRITSHLPMIRYSLRIITAFGYLSKLQATCTEKSGLLPGTTDLYTLLPLGWQLENAYITILSGVSNQIVLTTINSVKKLHSSCMKKEVNYRLHITRRNQSYIYVVDEHTHTQRNTIGTHCTWQWKENGNRKWRQC